MNRTKAGDRNEIVVTGVGSVTRYGVGTEALWNAATKEAEASSRDDYKLNGFKPVKHISDRRMMKAISKIDAIGLAAFETAVKESRVEDKDYEKERMGVYVGSPAASAYDNVEYMDSQRAADGDVKKFGSTCMTSRPTTLLLGLPNNVLCYGSLVLDARGPNDNYTSGELSGHLAMFNAARQIKRGRLDFAVAGGFSSHVDPVNSWLFYRLGHIRKPGDDHEPVTSTGNGAIPAEGGVFMTLERRENATNRGAKPLATYLGGCHRADAEGPDILAADSDGLERAITDALHQSGVEKDEVGLIFAGQTGFAATDELETKTIRKMWSDSQPVVATLSRHLGHTYEAGGLSEVAIAAELNGEVPDALLVDGSKSKLADDRPHFLILRCSPWGEYSCMVMRREASA